MINNKPHFIAFWLITKSYLPSLIKTNLLKCSVLKEQLCKKRAKAGSQQVNHLVSTRQFRYTLLAASHTKNVHLPNTV